MYTLVGALWSKIYVLALWKKDKDIEYVLNIILSDNKPYFYSNFVSWRPFVMLVKTFLHGHFPPFTYP